MNYTDVSSTVNDFLNYLETIQGKSPLTTKEYYYDLRLFLKFLISIGVQDEKLVQISELYSFMGYLTHERKNSNSSRCRKIASLKAYYRYLHKKARLIKDDPSIELEKPKPQKTLPKYLSVDESNNLLDTVDGKYEYRDYAMMTLFLNCGLRLSELVSINKSKIKGDILTVVGKGNKERTIYLNGACLDAIKNHIETMQIVKAKDRDALFLSERNTRISNKMVQFIIKRNMKTAGIGKEYSTHKLRHTAATLMYQHGGVDILVLKEILGHENVNTTQIYTHTDKKQLKDAVKLNPLANTRKAL